MHLKEAPPAVPRLLAAPSGSKIRKMLGQVTRPTVRLLVAVGRASGLPGAITTAHGYGVTVGSKGKLPLDHSLRRDPGGCNVRAVHDFRHHIQEDHGRQDKGAHVFVPRLRAIQAIGGQDGGRHQEIAVDNSQPNSSIPLDNDAGARAQLISSPQLLSIRRHPVAVDATSVANRVATPTSMDQVLCLFRHHRPWDASSAANEVAIPPVMRRMFSHRLSALQASQ